MIAMASQITGIPVVYATVRSGTAERKHQISVSLAFVLAIHRWPVTSPHKRPVMRKMFPFDDFIILWNNIDGLAQDCRNSIANALELLQSCTKPSIWLCISALISLKCIACIILNVSLGHKSWQRTPHRTSYINGTGWLLKEIVLK